MTSASDRFAAIGAGLGARRPLFSGVGLGAAAIVAIAMVAVRSPEVLTAIEADGAGVTPASGEPGSPLAPSASAAAPVAPKRTLATPDEIDAADTPQKLAALADAFPEDPAVLKRMAVSHAGQGDHSGAIRAVRKLVRISSAAASDEAVHQVVLRAANGSPEVMELAFELMSEGMGTVGGDLLYTIVTTDKMGKLPRERAEKLLGTEKVRALATPALLVAIDLRGTKSGCEKKVLFPRARDVADARSLPYLTPLLATSGCGFLSTQDCLKCLGGRQDLREAISAIQGRERGAKPAASTSGSTPAKP